MYRPYKSTVLAVAVGYCMIAAASARNDVYRRDTIEGSAAWRKNSQSIKHDMQPQTSSGDLMNDGHRSETSPDDEQSFRSPHIIARRGLRSSSGERQVKGSEVRRYRSSGPIWRSDPGSFPSSIVDPIVKIEEPSDIQQDDPQEQETHQVTSPSEPREHQNAPQLSSVSPEHETPHQQQTPDGQEQASGHGILGQTSLPHLDAHETSHQQTPDRQEQAGGHGILGQTSLPHLDTTQGGSPQPLHPLAGTSKEKVSSNDGTHGGPLWINEGAGQSHHRSDHPMDPTSVPQWMRDALDQPSPRRGYMDNGANVKQPTGKRAAVSDKLAPRLQHLESAPQPPTIKPTEKIDGLRNFMSRRKNAIFSGPPLAKEDEEATSPLKSALGTKRKTFKSPFNQDAKKSIDGRRQSARNSAMEMAIESEPQLPMRRKEDVAKDITDSEKREKKRKISDSEENEREFPSHGSKETTPSNPEHEGLDKMLDMVFPNVHKGHDRDGPLSSHHVDFGPGGLHDVSQEIFEKMAENPRPTVRDQTPSKALPSALRIPRARRKFPLSQFFPNLKVALQPSHREPARQQLKKPRSRQVITARKQGVSTLPKRRSNGRSKDDSSGPSSGQSSGPSNARSKGRPKPPILDFLGLVPKQSVDVPKLPREPPKQPKKMPTKDNLPRGRENKPKRPQTLPKQSELLKQSGESSKERPAVEAIKAHVEKRQERDQQEKRSHHNGAVDPRSRFFVSRQPMDNLRELGPSRTADLTGSAHQRNTDLTGSVHATSTPSQIRSQSENLQSPHQMPFDLSSGSASMTFGGLRRQRAMDITPLLKDGLAEKQSPGSSDFSA